MTDHLIELRTKQRRWPSAIRWLQALPGTRPVSLGDWDPENTLRGAHLCTRHAGRVKSPSYTLVEDYELPTLHLYHFDSYRFKDKKEWISSGFREYFGPDALCIVEWPERAAGLLAPADLEIDLQFREAGRAACLRPQSPAGSAWLQSSGLSSSSS